MYICCSTERKRPLMPHFKCVGCKTRLYSAAARADLVGDVCPGCGSQLEPVGELAEIVGFRSIEHRTIAADERPPSRHRQLGFDDGGSVSYEAAVAEAIALTAPNENP